MKAPDKIFLPRFVYEKWLYQTSDTDDETEVEYIRKDALLEWANSWLAFKRSGLVLDDGFSYAMEELIKKLNEM